MLKSARGKIEYSLGGRRFSETWRGFDFPVCEGVGLSGQIRGYRSFVKIHPLDGADFPVIHTLQWEIPFPFTPRDRIFLNGYQSWTDSRERSPQEIQPGLRFPGKLIEPIFKVSRYGDYHFVNYSGRRGDFHGFTYGYVRPGGGRRIIFLGSLSEKEGFTLIRASASESKIVVSWDCGDVVLNKARKVLELFVDRGEEDEVFNFWFKAMDIRPPDIRPAVGWTSWYNYYENISESIIMKNLEGFAEGGFSIDTFQIDDGYQVRTGDWLAVDPEKFPRGLSPLVKQIHAAGCDAGLWLAPFGAEKRSALVKSHPEWILKDRSGRKVWGGGNWGGFYALDIYNDEFRSYLNNVFHTILKDWRFDMVKLDFLYAACLAPPPDKTRGEVMADAVKILKKQVGNKKILACGVPLGSVFGKVEYCRIGCDVGLDWDSRLLKPFMPREGISTRNGLANVLGRRHLDGRAFLNDPDVFLLRNNNIKLSDEEKNTLFLINTVAGSLLFTSDEVAEYGEDRTMAFRSLEIPRRILSLVQEGEVYKIKYLEGRHERFMVANLSEEEYASESLRVAPRQTVII